MRKIVQITTTGVDACCNDVCEYVLTALCDDGSLWWKLNRNLHGEWVRLHGVPQGIEPPEAWPR